MKATSFFQDAALQPFGAFILRDATSSLLRIRSVRHKPVLFANAPFSLRSRRHAHAACGMRTRAIITTAVLVMLAAMTGAEAGVRRVVHVYADTIVVHPRAVSPPAEDIFVRGTVRVSKAKRPTKAALIACQMGPNFLGEAWRGKRYRPFTRTGRPRVCLTG